jgi:tRNA-specific 2-thiouridylase
MDENVLEVFFHEPQFAPTPGQRLVLYDAGGRVAAGGVIEYCEEAE